MPARGLGHPLAGQQLLPFPASLLQVQYTELEQILGTATQAVTAGVVTARRQIPLDTAHAHGLEDTCVAQFKGGLAADDTDNGREHETRRAAVDEALSWRVFDRLIEEQFDPAFTAPAPGPAGNPLTMAGAHGQQIAHGHGRQVLADGGRALAGKKIHYFGVQRQHAVIHQQPDGHGHPALGCRMLNVQPVCTVRRPKRFGHHRAVAIQHETVQLQARSVHRIDEITHATRRHALLAGQCPPQRQTRHLIYPLIPLLGRAPGSPWRTPIPLPERQAVTQDHSILIGVAGKVAGGAGVLPTQRHVLEGAALHHIAQA